MAYVKSSSERYEKTERVESNSYSRSSKSTTSMSSNSSRMLKNDEETKQIESGSRISSGGNRSYDFEEENLIESYLQAKPRLESTTPITLRALKSPGLKRKEMVSPVKDGFRKVTVTSGSNKIDHFSKSATWSSDDDDDDVFERSKEAQKYVDEEIILERDDSAYNVSGERSYEEVYGNEKQKNYVKGRPINFVVNTTYDNDERPSKTPDIMVDEYHTPPTKRKEEDTFAPVRMKISTQDNEDHYQQQQEEQFSPIKVKIATQNNSDQHHHHHHDQQRYNEHQQEETFAPITVKIATQNNSDQHHHRDHQHQYNGQQQEEYSNTRSTKQHSEEQHQQQYEPVNVFIKTQSHTEEQNRNQHQHSQRNKQQQQQQQQQKEQQRQYKPQQEQLHYNQEQQQQSQKQNYQQQQHNQYQHSNSEDSRYHQVEKSNQKHEQQSYSPRDLPDYKQNKQGIQRVYVESSDVDYTTDSTVPPHKPVRVDVSQQQNKSFHVKNLPVDITVKRDNNSLSEPDNIRVLVSPTPLQQREFGFVPVHKHNENHTIQQTNNYQETQKYSSSIPQRVKPKPRRNHQQAHATHVDVVEVYNSFQGVGKDLYDRNQSALQRVQVKNTKQDHQQFSQHEMQEQRRREEQEEIQRQQYEAYQRQERIRQRKREEEERRRREEIEMHMQLEEQERKQRQERERREREEFERRKQEKERIRREEIEKEGRRKQAELLRREEEERRRKREEYEQLQREEEERRKREVYQIRKREEELRQIKILEHKRIEEHQRNQEAKFQKQAIEAENQRRAEQIYKQEQYEKSIQRSHSQKYSSESQNMTQNYQNSGTFPRHLKKKPGYQYESKSTSNTPNLSQQRKYEQHNFNYSLSASNTPEVRRRVYSQGDERGPNLNAILGRTEIGKETVMVSRIARPKSVDVTRQSKTLPRNLGLSRSQNLVVDNSNQNHGSSQNRGFSSSTTTRRTVTTTRQSTNSTSSNNQSQIPRHKTMTSDEARMAQAQQKYLAKQSQQGNQQAFREIKKSATDSKSENKIKANTYKQPTKQTQNVMFVPQQQYVPSQQSISQQQSEKSHMVQYGNHSNVRIVSGSHFESSNMERARAAQKSNQQFQRNEATRRSVESKAYKNLYRPPPQKPAREYIVNSKPTYKDDSKDAYESIKVVAKGGIITLSLEDDEKKITDSEKQRLISSVYGGNKENRYQNSYSSYNQQSYNSYGNHLEESRSNQQRINSDDYAQLNTNNKGYNYQQNTSHDDDFEINISNATSLKQGNFKFPTENVFYTVCTRYFKPEENDWITHIHRMGNTKVPIGGNHRNKCVFWNQLYDPDKEDIIVRKLVPSPHLAAMYSNDQNNNSNMKHDENNNSFADAYGEFNNTYEDVKSNQSKYNRYKNESLDDDMESVSSFKSNQSNASRKRSKKAKLLRKSDFPSVSKNSYTSSSANYIDRSQAVY